MKSKKLMLIPLIFIIGFLSQFLRTNGESLLRDGRYIEETEYDDLGWKSVLNVEVKNNEIVDVLYYEIDKDGIKKSEDKEYSNAMKNTLGVSPEEAYEILENELLEKQGSERIDTVTGATNSSESFRKLTKKIIN